MGGSGREGIREEEGREGEEGGRENGRQREEGRGDGRQREGRD